MKQWKLDYDVKTVDGFRIEDAPKPEPGPGEVRIRVHAVSLNFRDQLVINAWQAWRIPGRDLVPVADGAGEIDAVGPDVTDWKVGDPVVEVYTKGWTDGPPPLTLTLGLGAGNEDGMLAEYVVLPTSRVARAPEGYSFAEASTLPCAAVTAWNALFGAKPVGPGQKVAVLGTGGVAMFSLQLAKAAGAEVYATSSSDAKLEQLKALGAVEGINYRTTPEWGQALFERFGGMDKVVDSVGEVNRAMSSLKPGGEVAVMGLMGSDGPPNPMYFMARTLTIRGTAVGSAASYEELRRFLEERKVKPVIGKSFAFEDAKDAYRAQSDGEVFGKVVIEVAPR